MRKLTSPTARCPSRGSRSIGAAAASAVHHLKLILSTYSIRWFLIRTTCHVFWGYSKNILAKAFAYISAHSWQKSVSRVKNVKNCSWQMWQFTLIYLSWGLKPKSLCHGQKWKRYLYDKCPLKNGTWPYFVPLKTF